MEDKRNLKCFFGLHQFVRIKEQKSNLFYEGDTLPSRVTVTYISECKFCGKISSKVVYV